ncbi:MAG TPA: divalent-cation tolerance protein CutA [Polyangia bacterium]
MTTTSTTEALVVLVTVPDGATADKLAEALVGERLAACVNVLGGVRSVYRWKGAVERAEELLCVCKTTRAAFPRLHARVVELHPYELPEVIALPVEAGHAPYLEWITASVG